MKRQHGSSAPATKDAGQGSSNTVPRQSLLKISDTVMHFFSEAHHAQSSIPAQPSHVVCVSQVGIAVAMREQIRTQGGGRIPLTWAVLSFEDPVRTWASIGRTLFAAFDTAQSGQTITAAVCTQTAAALRSFDPAQRGSAVRNEG